MADETENDLTNTVSHPELLDAGEARDGVVEKSGGWLELARGAL